jgi:hypothetical protein
MKKKENIVGFGENTVSVDKVIKLVAPYIISLL